MLKCERIWGIRPPKEMSQIGPRPHPVDDYRQYSLEYLRRLDVMPGITGLWQVCTRSILTLRRTCRWT